MTNEESHLPFINLLPNIVTLIGLTIGLTSIRYALDQKWENAVSLIVIAAFIDGFDGRIARALNASSKFGAALDSLADFVNFGVAPAILLYLWSLTTIPYKGIGWAITTLIIICCAFRLARFNSDEGLGNIFQGISAPCGGGLLLLPIMLSFNDLISFTITTYMIAVYSMTVAVMMASNIPTISIKNFQIHNRFFVPTLIIITIFFALLIIRPWICLPLIGLLYILSIPITVFLHRDKS
ncbi:MAG: CDP-diacylglycerol--serine O-phosphatidyltransferase [Rickettsiales bacterium]|jgi:CDP-diacylglycerol---serine O-phosphatidyltransferase|nr:CDP-diacylglycerol--serine O-phosphatidyltransferase [Rickettsiales bacterium]